MRDNEDASESDASRVPTGKVPTGKVAAGKLAAEQAAAGEIDVDTPSIARMYDYFLGGTTNFAVDRAAAADMLRSYPGNAEWCRTNRAFLARAVRELCRRGFDQFLDLGSGVPTVGNVHEIAQAERANARVAYVDVEPAAVKQAQLLVRDDSSTTMTRADVRRPDDVLAAPGVGELLDFDRPVAVLAVAILDIIDHDDAPGLMARYRDACCSGSALVVSNGAQLSLSDQEAAGAEDVMRETATRSSRLRDHGEVVQIFNGYELVEPGVVPSAAWRPDAPITREQADRSNAYAGVGVLP